MEETFCFFLPRIDPRTSPLTALCTTHCSNLSFCLLLLIGLYLSTFMFSHFRFVPRQLYLLFVIIVSVFSVISVALSCSSVCFQPICQLTDSKFIKHVSSPNLTFSYSFNRLCFVKWVSVFNC